VASGTVDMALAFGSNFAETVPVADVFSLVGAIPTDNYRDVVMELTPIIDAETRKHGVMVFGAHVRDAYVLATKEPIESMGDLQGLRLWAPGEWSGKAVKAFGAEVGSKGAYPGDTLYFALARGTFDGAFMSAEEYYNMNIYNLAPYITADKAWTVVGTMLIMNEAVFNGLSYTNQNTLEENYQDAIRHSQTLPVKEHFDQIFDSLEEVATVSMLSASESQLWGAKLEKVYKDFADETGEPGQKMYQIILKYRH